MPQNAFSQTLLATLLFVLLGFLLWRNGLNQESGPLKHAAETDQRFTEFVARQFSGTGNLQWALDGSTVQHDTGDRGYQISNPVLTVEDRQQKAPPWQLSAPLGRANEALTEIRFSGGVTGKRSAYNQQGSLHFSTQTLLVEPQAQTAHSAVLSRFSGQDSHEAPIWRSDSRGFLLNYRDQRLEQFQVRDRYLPPATTNKPANLTNRQSESAIPSVTHRTGAQP